MDKNKELIDLAYKAILRIHSNSAQQFCDWCNSYQDEFRCRVYNQNGIFDDNLKRYLNMLDEQATLNIFINKLLNEKINDNQKREPEFVKLKDIFNQANDSQPNQIFAFVITGTNKRVQLAIGDELFSKLIPNSHHDEHSSGWRPFLFGDDFNYNIEQILDEFKAKYGLHQLKVIFLEGMPDDKDVFVLDENMKNVIAIVDLLAIDNENEDVARLFDNKELVGVFTPISWALAQSLIGYMQDKNVKIFRKLSARYSQASCQLLQRSSEKNGMFQGLKILLDKKVTFKNEIADLNSLQNEQIRNLKLGL